MMLPKEDKKLCSGSLPPDVLSNLPENVLDDILIHLPIRDAVRTSILSKKWRCNWCRLPQLKLDQTLWDTTNDSIPLVTRFTDIVYHLLALHVGPITKFILSNIANMGNFPKIDNLVSFLSRNGIQHLILQFPEEKPYKLPSSFFTCSRMRHLSLHCCSFQPPSTFKGFSELVTLDLYDVTISSEILGSLISHSLMLKKLVLRISSILKHIQINAPKLKSFDFTGNIELLSLKNAPFLVSLSLVDTGLSVEAGKPDLSKYFESFPTLEHLHLNYYSVQSLAAGSGDIAAKLSSPLNSLKCLCLSGICLDELVELSIALCLIRSSPYLQDIQLKASDKLIDPVPDGVVYGIPASFTAVTLNHLRSVKLKGITGKRPEIELIKLLLGKSPVLVRMLIQPKIENESAETRLKVVTEITKFSRASPKAEVGYRSSV